MVVLSLNKACLPYESNLFPSPSPVITGVYGGVDELLGYVLRGGTVLVEEDPSS